MSTTPWVLVMVASICALISVFVNWRDAKKHGDEDSLHLLVSIFWLAYAALVAINVVVQIVR